MRYFYTLFTLIILFLIFGAKINSAFAQSYKLQLSPVGQTINVGTTFTVQVLINTGGIEAINGDVLLIYDPAKLSITNAQSANFFTYSTSTAISGTDNKYLASSWEESIAHAKSTATDTPFYNLTLQALSGGSTQLSFECVAGSEADTNINQASDSQDIVTCPLLPLSLNIGTGAGGGTVYPSPTSSQPTQSVQPTSPPVPTNTPIPTPTSPPPPTSTPRPTVSILPKAGIVDFTLGALGVGSLLTVLGILFML